MLTVSSNTDSPTHRAAMFLDYDNLHAVLTSQSSTNQRTSSYAFEILEEVCRYLEEGDDTPTILGRAYGAFDSRMQDDEDDVPSRLYGFGFAPTYVSNQTQRNASELQLTIDVTQFLATRNDIQTAVIVTGNRPYLPLARHIREQGRRVLVAAVNPPQNENTPAVAEDDLYLDARNLLSQDSREDLLANAPQNSPSRSRRGVVGAPPPRRYQELANPTARRTVAITDEHFGQYDEVYLTPLLRKLSEVLGPDHDPKALVGELEAAGAARLEKREGHPYDYTVLILNDDHPDVRAIRSEGLTSSASDSTAPPTGDGSAADVPETTESESSPDEATEDASVDDAPVAYDEHLMDEALAQPSPTSDDDAQDDDAPSSDVSDTTTSAQDAR
ncbi:MAG: NYN domain-containing protein [Salinibacter sp.]